MSAQYLPLSPVSLIPLVMIMYSSWPRFTMGGAWPGVNLFGSNAGREESSGGVRYHVNQMGIFETTEKEVPQSGTAIFSSSEYSFTWCW